MITEKSHVSIEGLLISQMTNNGTLTFNNPGAGISITTWGATEHLTALTDLTIKSVMISDSDIGLWTGAYCVPSTRCSVEGYPPMQFWPGIDGFTFQDVTISNALINGMHLHVLSNGTITNRDVIGAGSKPWTDGTGSAAFSIARSTNVAFDGCDAFNVVRPVLGHDGVGSRLLQPQQQGHVPEC